MEEELLSGIEEKWRECMVEISKIRQTLKGEHRVILLRRQTFHPHTRERHRESNHQPDHLLHLNNFPSFFEVKYFK